MSELVFIMHRGVTSLCIIHLISDLLAYAQMQFDENLQIYWLQIACLLAELVYGFICTNIFNKVSCHRASDFARFYYQAYRLVVLESL